ncbi:MAG: FtsW/RodA/SpoVE family cell cycle protein [Bacteroidaceae bacterium]|nr:FtsW/RodA/SpoVE family cell cycle protein [Bacteroidaceae bacterium]
MQAASGARAGRSLFKGDKVIWAIFFILCAISVIEVYSAASNLTYKTGEFWKPVVRHAQFLLGGAILVWAAHSIPCRWYKFYPVVAIPVSVMMLLYLLLRGAVTNGAARWINVLGIPLQPSEIAKGGVIVSVSLILSAMQTPQGADRHAFRYILWVAIPVCLLIFPENFSTAAFLFLVVIAMMFIGRIPLLQMGKLLGVLSLLMASAFAVVKYTPDSVLDSVSALHRLSTWKARLNKWTDASARQLGEKDFLSDKSIQETHASIAIATSSVVGKFPGNSVERDFLPQAFSDFIYAIIIEEMGLVGGVVVVMLYVILLFRASKIANRCERNFPAFLVLGLSLLLVTQAVINMAVAVGLFPVTGQPLPFISRGGSSTLINCMYIGMILSVSRFAKRRGAQGEVGGAEEAAFTSSEGMS